MSTPARGKKKRMIFCAVASLAFSASAFPAGLNFAGVPLTPPATVHANVPLSDLEKSYVSEGGNAVPSHTVAVLAVPRGFDPKKTWPVLVVFSSSDYEHQNRDALKMLYRPPALAASWVLLAGDGPQPARQDSSGWRAGHTLAALDAFHIAAAKSCGVEEFITTERPTAPLFRVTGIIIKTITLPA